MSKFMELILCCACWTLEGGAETLPPKVNVTINKRREVGMGRKGREGSVSPFPLVTVYAYKLRRRNLYLLGQPFWSDRVVFFFWLCSDWRMDPTFCLHV